MIFINENLINTTTQLSLDSNTVSAANVFSQDSLEQYISDGYNDDLTTTSITITFGTTTQVSKIALLDHNLKDYTLFYNGSTANTFSLTTTGATTTSDFSANSETSQFLFANTVSVSSITLDMSKTMSANAEKAIGRLIVSDLLLDFERIPSSKNYKPKKDMTSVIHKMSDGGVRMQYVSDKFDVSIKYKHISRSFRDNLKTVYDTRDNFIFVAFPTSTGWDKVIFDCLWVGSFDFFQYSDDATDAGYSGTIRLSEATL